ICRQIAAGRQRLPHGRQLFAGLAQDGRPGGAFEQCGERLAREEPLDRRDRTPHVRHGHLRGGNAGSGGIVSRCAPASAESGGMVSGGGVPARAVSGAGGAGAVNSAAPPPPRTPLMLTIPLSSIRYRALARSGRAGMTTSSRVGKGAAAESEGAPDHVGPGRGVAARVRTSRTAESWAACPTPLRARLSAYALSAVARSRR